MRIIGSRLYDLLEIRPLSTTGRADPLSDKSVFSRLQNPFYSNRQNTSGVVGFPVNRLRAFWKGLPESVRYFITLVSVIALAFIVLNLIGLAAILYQGRR